jgi:signal transduction histidine kinase
VVGECPDDSGRSDLWGAHGAAQVPAEAVQEFAHELSNLLTVIRFNAQLVARQSGDGTSRRQIDEIDQAASRAARLVAGLHDLASAGAGNGLEQP